MDKHLKLAKSLLEEQFYCTFRDNNVLEVSVDEEDVPFLFLIVEKPEVILMSFSIDFSNAALAAQLAISLKTLANVLVAENFYLSKSGEVFWADEAIIQYSKDIMFEEKNSLADMKPISSLKN